MPDRDLTPIRHRCYATGMSNSETTFDRDDLSYDQGWDDQSSGVANRSSQAPNPYMYAAGWRDSARSSFEYENDI